jgi:L-amino acid N-acyltransferase YncA
MLLEFKYAREKDLAKIISTYNSTIPSGMVTADLEPVSAEQKKDWFHSHSDDRRPLWMVYRDGNYAGWMSFTSFYGRPAYHGTVEISVYLEENMRSRGIGRMCLEKALAEAPPRKIHTMLGFIFGHNVPSIRLFKLCGFDEWGRLPEVADMNGTMRDLLIMGRKM